MNKQLAKKGITLSKNMTNIESLNLTDLTVESTINCSEITVANNLEVDEITSHFINTEAISTPELAADCSSLALPTAAPAGNITPASIYCNTATQSLRIYDSVHWYQVLFTQVP